MSGVFNNYSPCILRWGFSSISWAVWPQSFSDLSFSFSVLRFQVFSTTLGFSHGNLNSSPDDSDKKPFLQPLHQLFEKLNSNFPNP